MPHNNEVKKNKYGLSNYNDDLSVIITSLFYLSKEAQEADLGDISTIILQAISSIKDYTIKKNYESLNYPINKDAVNIISFLSEFIELPEDKKNSIVSIITDTEGTDE
ncbi:MAG: hypothetical protein ACRBB3_10455 [Alphaproteobacteria bacterium]